MKDGHETPIEWQKYKFVRGGMSTGFLFAVSILDDTICEGNEYGDLSLNTLKYLYNNAVQSYYNNEHKMFTLQAIFLGIFALTWKMWNVMLQPLIMELFKPKVL